MSDDSDDDYDTSVLGLFYCTKGKCCVTKSHVVVVVDVQLHICTKPSLKTERSVALPHPLLQLPKRSDTDVVVLFLEGVSAHTLDADTGTLVRAPHLDYTLAVEPNIVHLQDFDMHPPINNVTGAARELWGRLDSTALLHPTGIPGTNQFVAVHNDTIVLVEIGLLDATWKIINFRTVKSLRKHSADVTFVLWEDGVLVVGTEYKLETVDVSQRDFSLSIPFWSSKLYLRSFSSNWSDILKYKVFRRLVPGLELELLGNGRLVQGDLRRKFPKRGAHYALRYVVPVEEVARPRRKKVKVDVLPENEPLEAGMPGAEDAFFNGVTAVIRENITRRVTLGCGTVRYVLNTDQTDTLIENIHAIGKALLAHRPSAPFFFTTQRGTSGVLLQSGWPRYVHGEPEPQRWAVRQKLGTCYIAAALNAFLCTPALRNYLVRVLKTETDRDPGLIERLRGPFCIEPLRYAVLRVVHRSVCGVRVFLDAPITHILEVIINNTFSLGNFGIVGGNARVVFLCILYAVGLDVRMVSFAHPRHDEFDNVGYFLSSINHVVYITQDRIIDSAMDITVSVADIQESKYKGDWGMRAGVIRLNRSFLAEHAVLSHPWNQCKQDGTDLLPFLLPPRQICHSYVSDNLNQLIHKGYLLLGKYRPAAVCTLLAKDKPPRVVPCDGATGRLAAWAQGNTLFLAVNQKIIEFLIEDDKVTKINEFAAGFKTSPLSLHVDGDNIAVSTWDAVYIYNKHGVLETDKMVHGYSLYVKLTPRGLFKMTSSEWKWTGPIEPLPSPGSEAPLVIHEGDYDTTARQILYCNKNVILRRGKRVVEVYNPATLRCTMCLVTAGDIGALVVVGDYLEIVRTDGSRTSFNPETRAFLGPQTPWVHMPSHDISYSVRANGHTYFHDDIVTLRRSGPAIVKYGLPFTMPVVMDVDTRKQSVVGARAFNPDAGTVTLTYFDLQLCVVADVRDGALLRLVHNVPDFAPADTAHFPLFPHLHKDVVVVQEGPEFLLLTHGTAPTVTSCLEGSEEDTYARVHPDILSRVPLYPCYPDPAVFEDMSHDIEPETEPYQCAADGTCTKAPKWKHLPH